MLVTEDMERKYMQQMMRDERIKEIKHYAALMIGCTIASCIGNLLAKLIFELL